MTEVNHFDPFSRLCSTFRNFYGVEAQPHLMWGCSFAACVPTTLFARIMHSDTQLDMSSLSSALFAISPSLGSICSSVTSWSSILPKCVTFSEMPGLRWNIWLLRSSWTHLQLPVMWWFSPRLQKQGFCILDVHCYLILIINKLVFNHELVVIYDLVKNPLG